MRENIRAWLTGKTLDRLPFTVLYLATFALHEGLIRLLMLHAQPPIASGSLSASPRWWALIQLGELGAGATALAVSTLFLSCGAFLVIKRWQATALPFWFPFFLLVPWVSWLGFVLLAVAPSDISPQVKIGGEIAPWLKRAILFLTTLASLLLIYLSAERLEAYGWALFVGLPFVHGLAIGSFVGLNTREQPAQLVLYWGVSPLLLPGLLLAFRLEGLSCLLMAAPLVMGVALLGALIGCTLRTLFQVSHRLFLLTSLFLLLPLLMGAEAARSPEPPLVEVTTAIEVAAPPEVVWRHVVSFPRLPPPESWLFRTGIAYPIAAYIQGEGVGAVRYCEFSTGSFVEPIEVWDPPHLLSFSVSSSPHPMREWNPFYDSVEPPHLDGFLVSKRGQFRLVPLPDGSTRLEGTTWYSHGMWPAFYWRLWSDHIIHKIHLRVLEHIAGLAESAA